MSYCPPMPESVSADRSAPTSHDHAEGLLALARKIQKTKGVNWDRAWSEAVSQLNPEVNDSSNSSKSSEKPEVLAGTNGVSASWTDPGIRDFWVIGKILWIRTKVD
jgi:hypothetical protein